MRKPKKALWRVVGLVALLLMCSLPAFAYADNGTSPTEVLDPEGIEGLALSPDPATEPASTDPAAGEQTVFVSQRDVPINAAPYEAGWSLVNLMATILTILIGAALVFSSMLRQEKSGQPRTNFGFAVVCMALAVSSTILFASTEDIGTHMIAVDSYTVAHIAILALGIFCVVLSVARDTKTNTGNREVR